MQLSVQLRDGKAILEIAKTDFGAVALGRLVDQLDRQPDLTYESFGNQLYAVLSRVSDELAGFICWQIEQ